MKPLSPGRESFNLSFWYSLQVQCTCLCYISSMLAAFYLNCITFAICYMTDHHVVWSASKLCRLCDQCLSDHFLTCQHHCRLATNEHPIDWPIALSKLHKNIHVEDHRLTSACCSYIVWMKSDFLSSLVSSNPFNDFSASFLPLIMYF